MTVLALVVLLFAQSPVATARQALLDGKAAIERRDYESALQSLQKGLLATNDIEDDGLRAQASAALHFYSALAYAFSDRNAHAREQIEMFLLATPGNASLETGKYPAHFVSLFREVADVVQGDPSSEFDRLYPGFRHFQLTQLSRSEEMDGEPEIAVLGTEEEKRQWQALPTRDALLEFRRRFWERRDPTPSTPQNEFRDQFETRRRFADEMFAGEDGIRGSLSDRGQVFILLGKPLIVSSRPLDSSDGTLPLESTAITGEAWAELWVYAPEQLPVSVRGKRLPFKFITHRLFGDHRLDPTVFNRYVIGAAVEQAIRK